jgi:cell wall-associated NlpC family hydrolase
MLGASRARRPFKDEDLTRDFIGPIARVLTHSLTVSLAGLTVFSVLTVNAVAEPAQDALATLNDLSRQAEQTTEALHSAQLDLNAKVSAMREADKKHADDQAAADAAKAHLGSFQGAVDKLAAATYMGGSVDGMQAILSAGSPQGLIDRLTMQRVMATQMAGQMASFKLASAQAATAEQESATSAAAAKSAAEQAAAVRTGLQAKAGQLQVQIAVVKSQYRSLTPQQRTTLAGPGGAVLADFPIPDAPPLGIEEPPAAPAPDAAPAFGVPAPPPIFGAGERGNVVQAALSQVGSPYVWGGAAPGGFDCSGLVMWSYRQAGINLPHSSQAMASGGQPVSLSDLQPGDVVTYYSDASHAGMYVGNGMVIHASTYGVPVAVVPVDAAGPIFNARRY